MRGKTKPLPVVIAGDKEGLAGLVGGVAWLGSKLWPWRRELGTVAVLVGGWWLLARVLAGWAGFVASVAGLALVVAVPRVREGVWGWLRCSVTRRQLLAGLAETRSVNVSGQLPRVARIKPTAVGERVLLVARPGHSAELLDVKVEELRAATRCRELRVTRDENQSHRITVDVVRRDPLANSRDVPWADADKPTLSMWDPITIGVDEDGQAVKLSLRERGLLGGGEPGSGKSSMASVILAHAAKSPDAHLVLIDPNEVQFGPWRERALAFAADDPADALEALAMVRDEVSRRLSLLRSLPGVVRKVTPEVAAEYGLPVILLAIDELAFHTSVVGTDAQRRMFNTFCRDIVARSRAAGVVPVMFTQRPTADVVPTSLRDLFSVRCAFRTTTKASSDVILGEGWARQGYSATDIDITARGVGWLLAEGQKPRRFKGAWLPDELIAELAVSTVALKPPPPPSPADVDLVAEAASMREPDQATSVPAAAPVPRSRRRSGGVLHVPATGRHD